MTKLWYNYKGQSIQNSLALFKASKNMKFYHIEGIISVSVSSMYLTYLPSLRLLNVYYGWPS